ncbi:hypothetical protein C8Q77DRAFT_334136 [Trametes polyzona]|nr:hypothetical protein C8Q77DRAFT_334136 [Trametes polyzona]
MWEMCDRCVPGHPRGYKMRAIALPPAPSSPPDSHIGSSTWLGPTRVITVPVGSLRQHRLRKHLRQLRRRPKRCVGDPEHARMDLNDKVFTCVLGWQEAVGPDPPTPPKSPEMQRQSISSAGRASTPQLRVDTASATGASTTTAHAPPTTVPSTAPPMTTKAISDLSSAMRKTLAALGTTFEVLGDQILSVATLGPAMGAVVKIDQIRGEVERRRAAQDALMDKTKVQTQERVKERIRAQIRPKVQDLVAKAVAARIQDGVKKEQQVPQVCKLEAIEAYRRRILEVKIELANLEARRRNALSAREEGVKPLVPLLRPVLGAPLGTQDGTADAANATTTANGTASAGSSQAPKKPNNANGKNKGKKSGAQAGAGAGGVDGANGAEAADLAGTPSELFPRSVHELRTLDAQKARRLVVEYGVVPPGEDDDEWEDLGEEGKAFQAAMGGSKGGSGSGGGTNAKEKAEKEKAEKAAKERAAKLHDREVRRTADLNAFMQFIGVSPFSCVFVASSCLWGFHILRCSARAASGL